MRPASAIRANPSPPEVAAGAPLLAGRALVQGIGRARDRIYARMIFDTVSAAGRAAQGTDANPDDVIAVARRASIALTCTDHPS